MQRFLRWLFFLAFSIAQGCVFSNPLSGVYTIGGASPNYTTLTAAVSALNTSGISGPVTFNIRAGNYTGQVIIEVIGGSSAANTVTFQSESGVASDVTITYTPTGVADDYVIYLNGASHMTFKDLTVTAVGDTFAKTFVLKNGSSNINFSGNILNCGLSAWDVVTSMVIDASPDSGQNNDSIVLIGNQINGGSIGYETEGSGTGENTGLLIENNTFSNTFYAAIHIGYCNSAIIQANTFSQTTGYAISILNYCDQIRIEENNINAGNGYALYIDSAGVAGREGLIANNFIAAQVALSGNACSYQLFYNNTIYAFEYAVLLRGGTGNVFENNIVYNYNNFGSDAIFDMPGGSFAACDYNDYYNLGLYFGQWGDTICDSLAQWQAVTGFDAHSRTVLPPFVSDSDLRLTSCDSLRFGVPLALVPYDIDSNPRSLVTTVVGAYECPSGILVQFTANETAICAGQTVSFTSQATNNANTWQWTFYGGTPGSSGSQNPAVVYDTAGVYSVKLVASNDSVSDSLTKTAFIIVNPVPVKPVLSAADSVICPYDSTLVTAPGTYASYIWNNGDTGSFTYAGTNGGYWVTVTSAEGCSVVSDTALISMYPVPQVAVSAQGDTLAAGNYAAYQWYLNGSPIQGATSALYVEHQNGDYLVMITDSNGCRAFSSVVAINYNGIAEMDDNSGLCIYPNPFSGLIAVELTGANEGIQAVKIYDEAGRIALNANYGAAVTGFLQIHVPALPQGVYYIKISNSMGMEYLRRIVRQ